MVTVILELPDGVHDDLLFLSGKLGEPITALGVEALSAGLKRMNRRRKTPPRTLGDAASLFKNWLEHDCGFSNNTARTQSSLARKLLKLAAERGDGTMSNPNFIAGTMSQPANARRAWQLWQQFCAETDRPIMQLAA